MSSKIRSHDVAGVSREAKKTILAAWEKDGVSVEALKKGSRRGRLPGLRVQLAKDLVENHGLTMAETARQLGVTTSAISRISERNKRSKIEFVMLVNNVPLCSPLGEDTLLY